MISALSAMSLARSASACVARVTSLLSDVFTVEIFDSALEIKEVNDVLTVEIFDSALAIKEVSEELTDEIFDSALTTKLPKADSACVARVISLLSDVLTAEVFDSALAINEVKEDDTLSMLFCKVISAVTRALDSVARSLLNVEMLALTLDIADDRLAFIDARLESVFETRLINELSTAAISPLRLEFVSEILDSALAIKAPSADSAATARAVSLTILADRLSVTKDRLAVERPARAEILASMPANLSSTVVEKFASSPSAAANSLRVFRVSGAEATKLAMVLAMVVLTVRSV